MFTAQIKQKNIVNGEIVITVLFSDGITNHTDSCKPQDKDGFRFWVKSKLATLNATPTLDTDYTIDDIVDVSDVIETPPVLTQPEIDRNTWLTKYAKWVKIKTTIVDTNIVVITNPQLQTLLNDLKTTLLPEYIDYI